MNLKEDLSGQETMEDLRRVRESFFNQFKLPTTTPANAADPTIIAIGMGGEALALANDVHSSIKDQKEMNAASNLNFKKAAMGKSLVVGGDSTAVVAAAKISGVHSSKSSLNNSNGNSSSSFNSQTISNPSFLLAQALASTLDTRLTQRKRQHKQLLEEMKERLEGEMREEEEAGQREIKEILHDFNVSLAAVATAASVPSNNSNNNIIFLPSTKNVTLPTTTSSSTTNTSNTFKFKPSKVEEDEPMFDFDESPVLPPVISSNSGDTSAITEEGDEDEVKEKEDQTFSGKFFGSSLPISVPSMQQKPLPLLFQIAEDPQKQTRGNTEGMVVGSMLAATDFKAIQEAVERERLKDEVFVSRSLLSYNNTSVRRAGDGSAVPLATDPTANHPTAANADDDTTFVPPHIFLAQTFQDSVLSKRMPSTNRRSSKI